jgi:3-dehydroquinate synthase
MNVKTIKVELGPRSYPIQIGGGTLEQVGTLCAERGLQGRCLVISDTHVAPLYARPVVQALEAAGFNPALEVLPAGENTKRHGQLLHLYDTMLAHGMDRRSFVVALGGGVIGDLAGFAAASFLRGIPFVQIPTTLLAMVDSSVGGKTGINLPQGKNLIGAFHQPRAVLMDLSTLSTLPQREYRAGLAEVVKYGMIWDAGFFGMLEENLAAVHCAASEMPESDSPQKEQALLAQVVGRCCEIKAEVVRQDEQEGGLRAILNFGHTVGHAIEKAAGYGTFLHGEAVAAGMVFAARASVQCAGLDAADADRLERMLCELKLPVAAPQCAWSTLRNALAADKKTVGGVPKFVLVGPLGTAQTGCEIGEADLAQIWHRLGQ